MTKFPGPSGHMDTFTRDNLPSLEPWPDILPGPINYPDRVNAGFELCDRMVQAGFGDRIAVIGHGRQQTYRQVRDRTNRLARVLCENFGLKPGNRVLIRSANNPAMVNCWLAAAKAGAVAVHVPPELRAGELANIIDKARIRLALCDTRIMDDLAQCSKESRFLDQVVGFDGTGSYDSELDRMALTKPVRFDAVPTGRDDVALLAVDSGAAGGPKAGMHFHGELLAVADGFARNVLQITPDDVIVGSLPVVHTLGLVSLVICSLRFGAATVLLEHATPWKLVELVERSRASIVFSVPATCRAMLDAMDEGADLSSIRAAVLVGRPLPAALYAKWKARTGKPILNGIGAIEHAHIYISNRIDDAQGDRAGTPSSSYEARVVGEDGEELPRAENGRLAARGYTGCRHLPDKERQRDDERRGSNLFREAAGQDERGEMQLHGTPR